MAASDQFVIDVRGRGGHGAAPHATFDAIVSRGGRILYIRYRTQFFLFFIFLAEKDQQLKLNVGINNKGHHRDDHIPPKK